MTELLKTGIAITCHAWNKDRTQLAMCPNNNEVHIYVKEGSDWNCKHVLKEHDQVVTSICWGEKTNRIVTCSLDRNAYVWTWENNTWKPVLVILRIPRAATAVKWSPNEDKFAVASSAKCVAVCFFDNGNNWWVSRHIKKHKSTVLGISWHPNNVLLLTASSDFKVRVFSAWIKNVDQKPGDTPFGNRLPFGEFLGEYVSGGWVHNAVWSPSGNRFAFVSHDSTATVVDVSGGSPGNVQVVKLAFLPLTDLLFVNEDTIVAVGHDMTPLVISNTGGSWAFSNLIQEKKDPVAQKTGGTKQAFELFKNKVEVGANENTQKLSTIHQNCITCVTPFESAGGTVKKFATSGLDGKLIIWNSQ
jgi:actin related protein 2/3 complex subunit 1A/1B